MIFHNFLTVFLTSVVFKRLVSEIQGVRTFENMNKIIFLWQIRNDIIFLHSSQYKFVAFNKFLRYFTIKCKIIKQQSPFVRTSNFSTFVSFAYNKNSIYTRKKIGPFKKLPIYPKSGVKLESTLLHNPASSKFNKNFCSFSQKKKCTEQGLQDETLLMVVFVNFISILFNVFTCRHSG